MKETWRGVKEEESRWDGTESLTEFSHWEKNMIAESLTREYDIRINWLCVENKNKTFPI